MNNMKLILCASVILTAIVPVFGFGFGNNRCNNSCNNAGISNSTCITVIDTLRAWNGQPIGQFLKIKGHEYIIVRSGNAVQIIHAESCPCKTK